MSTLKNRSKNLFLSPITIQPRVKKAFSPTDEKLPETIKSLKNVAEVQYFEVNETQTECYLIKFNACDTEWQLFELFYIKDKAFNQTNFNKIFHFY